MVMGQQRTETPPSAELAVAPEHAGGATVLSLYGHRIPPGGDYAVWELDFRAVVNSLADLRLQGVIDLKAYLLRRPDQLDRLFERVRVVSNSSSAGKGFGKSRFGQPTWAGILDHLRPEGRADILAAFDRDVPPDNQRLRLRPGSGPAIDATLSIIVQKSRRAPVVAYLTVAQRGDEEAEEGAAAAQSHVQILGELRKFSKNVSRTSNDETTVTLCLKAALKISGAEYCLLLRPGQPARRGRLHVTAFARASAKLRNPELPESPQLEFGAAFFNVSEPRFFTVPGEGYGQPILFNGRLAAGSYLAVPFPCEHGTQTCSLLLAKDIGGGYAPDVVNALSTLSALATLSLDRACLARRAREDRDRHQQDFRAAQQLAAIVESSSDAMLTKDLNGIITSWNAGARRLFGYEAGEAIGQPVTMLIPPDRLNEEVEILAKIRAGKRVEHYQTERMRKDGGRINISLTVSPVRDLEGKIVGASKVARDITDTVRAQNLQGLLLQEMDHRIKNLFALCSSIVSLCGQKASTPRDLVQAIRSRLMALARAHDLVFSRPPAQGGAAGAGQLPTGPVSLHALLETVLAPFQDELPQGRPRIRITGTSPDVAGQSIATIALLVHEFATNATKYGSLGQVEGSVDIDSDVRGEQLVLHWREAGTLIRPPDDIVEGFGSVMTRAAVEKQLNGAIARRWGHGGLEIEMTLSLERLQAG